MNARGGVFRVQPAAKASPVLYGYESSSFPVYFNQAPLFTVAARDTIVVEGGDPALDVARERMRAKVVLKFHDKVDSLLVSGLTSTFDIIARQRLSRGPASAKPCF